jgi:WD40 repeat protein
MDRAKTASLEGNSESVGQSRADRVRSFTNFVSSQTCELDAVPDLTISIAFNRAASGLVADLAGELIRSFVAPWLERYPRPPAPPETPACLRTLQGHTYFVHSVALTPDGRTAVSASSDETLRV